MSDKLIPKIIHYCWFGGNPLPKSALKCIASWRKFFPNYEIKEWNESNFDVNIIPYTKEAYDAKKYAFVSDYARFWILYNYGGLYFDTDVEVVSSYADILEKGPFMGIELPYDSRQRRPAVNPGLGIGAVAGMPLYKQMLGEFESLDFYMQDGRIQTHTMIPIISEILFPADARFGNEPFFISGVIIYPQDYFNPYDPSTGEIKKTSNTHSVHWYDATWLNDNRIRVLIRRMKRCFSRNKSKYILL